MTNQVECEKSFVQLAGDNLAVHTNMQLTSRRKAICTIESGKCFVRKCHVLTHITAHTWESLL